MRHHSIARLLRNAATDLPESGGATPPAAQVPAAAPAAAAPPREPTLLEKVQAAVRDKSGILAENNSFKDQIQALQGTLAERDTALTALQARVVALETENGLLQADFTSIDTALKASEAKVVSIDTAAARQLASMGVEASLLPAATTEPVETFASIKAQIEKETDPAKLWALTDKLENLPQAD